MYYIYEIKNKINYKTYIGQRKCPKNKFPETDTKYMGSGKILIISKEKYGIENFSKSILAVTETKEIVDILEKVFIALYRSEGKAEYNIADSGQISFSGDRALEINNKISKAHLGKHLSEEHKRKIGMACKGNFKDEECRKKISLKNKGKKFSDEFREKCRQRQLGKHHSEETRRKMSLAQKGVKKSPEHIKAVSEALTGLKHKSFSEESRKRMSIGQKLRWERIRENEHK